jgi:hypothetical protein
MDENFSKRGEQIFESAKERVSLRIEQLAKTWKKDKPYQIAYRDGAPDGVLQFYLLHENFRFAEPEEQAAFFETLCLTDDVISKENARIVEESDFEAYIEVEPRKDW